MAKKNNTEEKLAAVEETLSRTEQWIEQNQKKISKIIFIIIAIIALYFAYDNLYIEPLNKEAYGEMFVAERHFEIDSFNIALNGDGQYLGFIDIANDYKGTEAGNLANYYAGICYLNMGLNNDAIEYLNKFNSKDEIVSTNALGSIGDAYMNLGDLDNAISYWKKAAYNSKNNFTTPIYLKRTALGYEENKNYNKALKIYEEIKKKYSDSPEATDIEKYITKLSIMK